MDRTAKNAPGPRDESGQLISNAHVLEWISDPVSEGLDPEPLQAWAGRQLKEAPARAPEHWERLARASGRSVAATSSESSVDQR